MIDARSARIDVEISDARQHSRFLPAEKPAASGYEAQLAAEFTQRRFRQALKQRLAVVPLLALAHDEHVTWRLESIFERLTSDDFYGIGLDSIQRRQMTTRDVRWGNTNDRLSRSFDGRSSARGDDNQSTHEGSRSLRSGLPRHYLHLL